MSIRSLAGWCGVVACLVAGSLVAASPAGAVAGYGDVAGDRYYTEPVQWSVDNDVTGIDGNCFLPDEPVSRGEAAGYIWNMEGQPSAPAHSFVDVTGEGENAAVSWMSHNEITTGTSPTMFGPDVTLTRAHLVTFLHRLADEPEAPPHSFNDVHATWQQDSVSWASDTGITTGTTPTTFSPDDTLTRAHLVTFLHRYQDKPEVTVDPTTPECDPEAEAAAAALTASHGELSAVPGEATVVAYRGQGSVSWSATEAMAGSPVPGYEVQWKGPGQSWDRTRRAVVIGLSYAVSGLSDGVVYTMRVRPAIVEKAEVAGASIVSAQSTAPTATLVAPVAPLDESRDVSAFDGAVDLEMTGEIVWPATIEIPVDMAKIDHDDFVFLMSFNEQYQVWLPEPGAVFDRERGVITAEVYHLSWWDSVKAAPGAAWRGMTNLGAQAVNSTTEFVGDRVDDVQEGISFVYDVTRDARDGVVYVISEGYAFAIKTYTKVRDSAFAAARATWEAARFVAAMGWEAFVSLVEEWVDKFTTSFPTCSNTEPDWVSSIEVPERGAPLVVCPETVGVDSEPDLRLKVTADRLYPLLLTARNGSGTKINISDTDHRERIHIESSEGSSALSDVAAAWFNDVVGSGKSLLPAGTTQWLRIPRSALMDQQTLTLEGTYDGLAANLNTAMLGVDLLADVWEIPISSDEVARFQELSSKTSGCFSQGFDATSSEEERIGSFNETVECLTPIYTQAIASKVIRTLLSPVLFLLEAIFQIAGYGQAGNDIANGNDTPKTTIQAKPKTDNGDSETDSPTEALPTVSAGGWHSCGVGDGGSVKCWGLNDDGQADAPSGVFTTVSAGGFHSCGIRGDGSLECWGRNGDGQAEAPSGEFTAVSSGRNHSCGKQSGGPLQCWGNNDYGQLDVPERVITASAVHNYTCGLRIDGFYKWSVRSSKICWGDDSSERDDKPAGAFATTSHNLQHSCGVRFDDSIECWGNNDYGQTDPPNGEFATVSTGGHHSCGVRLDGTFECWGRNNYGQANPLSGPHTSDTAPATPNSFKSVTAGEKHSCGLRTNNTITCWGNNGAGQSDAPAGAFKTVTAGAYHSCGLRTNNTITCWGNNRDGQSDAPTGTFQTVTTGSSHSCGLRTNNTITCWGDNDYGQSDAPTGTFQTVTTGLSYSCGLRTNNTITCWGYNDYGQSDAPTGTFQTVTTGQDHSCGLRTNNTITCWGYNHGGQTDAPTGTFQTVTAGSNYSCGIRTDNTITCWLYINYRQFDAPAGTFQTVTVGRNHSCGIRTDNTITCWLLRYGQLDAPAGTFQTVTTGRDHFCGIRTNNTITCWGDNDYGQSDATAGTFQTVTAGRDHSCGIRTDNTITCWGDNTYPTRTEAFKTITSGVRHFCGIRTDNTISCWGYNDVGQSDAPAGAFKTITSGNFYSCGLRTDNTITCWGNKYQGGIHAPGGAFKTVTTRSEHSCGLRTDNTITCWGKSAWGRTDAPTGTFQTVTTGWSHSCGLRINNTVTCWGNNDGGQSDAPTGTFQTVTTGWSHSCGLRINNTVTCWGDNDYGQSDAPTGTFQTVTTGQDHSCGLRTNNTITCWGNNHGGQSDAPTGTFQTVTTGQDHSCGLRTGGMIVCWGAESMRTVDPGTVGGGATAVVSKGGLGLTQLAPELVIPCAEGFQTCK